MFRTLLLLCFVTVGYCETQCQSSFYQCMNETIQNLKAKYSATSTTGENQMKAKSQCYTDYNCKVPEDHTENHGQLNAKAAAAVEKMKELFKPVLTAIEKCVQTEYSQFTFPSFNGQQQGEHQSFAGHPGMSGGLGAVTPGCANADNSTKVLNCLKNLEMKPLRFMCNVAKNCANKSGSDCPKEFKNIKDKLCNCSKDRTVMMAAFPGRNAHNNAGGHRGTRGAFAHENQWHGGAGNNEIHTPFKMENPFCVDPCSKLEDSENDHPDDHKTDEKK